MELKKTTVYLTQDQISGISAMARRKGRPKAQLIREAVAAYIVDDVDFEWPRSIGMVTDDDGELTSENVDEWLKANWHPE